ncbi:MAG: hypothetical protein ACRC5Q_01675 [Culicoidibacterales bacterium]
MGWELEIAVEISARADSESGRGELMGCGKKAHESTSSANGRQL